MRSPNLLLRLALLPLLAVAGRGADVVLNPAADTFIVSSVPDNNAGAHTWLDAGTDGVGGVRRGLLRFDLSSIPAGATITAASLDLTVLRVPSGGGTDSSIGLHRVLAAWNEGTQTGVAGSPAAADEANWTSRIKGTADWTLPGASDATDAAAGASAAVVVGSDLNATYTWNGLAADIQSWVDSPAQNFGWLLKSASEGTARTVRGFATRDNATARPVLRVSYVTAPPPNQAPTISLTTPTNGASFTVPASVTLLATAADADGSVTNVEFFDGAASLGSRTAPPYTLTAPLLAGSHTLTAAATDNLGATTTSAAVTITVNSVAISNPIAERIPKGDIAIELQPVADGMSSPLGMAVPDDGSARFFVFDQFGVVWVVTPAGRLATPMLDVRLRLAIPARYDYDERGLLGLAVHPNFAQNPFIYTYTSETNGAPADFPSTLNPGTTNNHQSVITEWRIDPGNSNRVDPASRREILRVDQPQSNHNGGAMNFGPDGLLYVTLGDGGQSNDVGNGHKAGGNSQATDRILGKMIRIDVDARTSPNGHYGLPADNPFDGINGLREIYAYGLRNPFSFSFDRQGGTLYLADVGQNRVEEINIITRGGNYGWNVKEGTFWFDATTGTIVTEPTRPVPPGLIDPIAQYDHDDGSAIIGGFVYRGSRIPELQGRYVFGDWGSFATPSGRLYYLDAANSVKELRIGSQDRPLGLWLKGFGQDANGELYVLGTRVVGPAGNSGRLLRVIPAPRAIEVTSITRPTTTNVNEVWCGGMGPYVVQQKNSLSDPVWMNRAVTMQTNATVAVDTRAAFFRVADAARQPAIPLSATISPANERPNPLNLPANGSAFFSLDGNTLTFTIRYAALTGNATAAHIHGPAGTGGNAPVVLDFAPYNNGGYSSNGVISGPVVISDSLKAMILAGQTYVNVHTAANGPGEMRGQIAPVQFVASLNGANERPTPRNVSARGIGLFSLVGTQLTFNVTYRGLTGPATAAHIHGPASLFTSAGILVDLAPFNGGAFGASGTLSGSVGLTPAQLTAVVDGLTYVNIHTAAFGPGEIRGQILPQVTAVPFTAPLTGLSQRPTPLTNNASGEAFLSLEGNQLTFSISYKDLSGPATAAHIHGPATSAGNAGVMVDLAPHNGGAFGTSGTFAGTVTVTPAQITALLNGQTYVNVHTALNPPGEIRGQVAPVLMRTYLSGSESRPAVVSTGTGRGNFALVLNQLSFGITYRDLTTTATASHIHGPAAVNQSAGVMIDFAPFNGGAYATNGGMFGSVAVTPAQRTALVDQLTYVNVHTTTVPGGEIRGQVLR